MKKLLIHLSILSLLAAVALPMVACAPKQDQSAGEQMEDAADQAGDAMEDAADKAGDAMEEGAEDMGESMDEMTDDDGGAMDEGDGMMNEDDGGMMNEEKPADQGEGSM
jgi:hypothetical protein